MMRKIKENQKITLTFGQLKRLIKESINTNLLMELRDILSEINYRREPDGKLVEFEEEFIERDKISIHAYMASPGWGGGNFMWISDKTANRIFEKFKTRFDVTSWELEDKGKRLIIYGDFSELKNY